MRRHLTIIVSAAALMLAGCAANVTRDTWAGADARLQEAHRVCMDKANADNLQGTALGGGGLVGRAVRPSYYKDCMEEHGYHKVKSEEISLGREEACGGVDQTCVEGAGWCALRLHIKREEDRSSGLRPVTKPFPPNGLPKAATLWL